MGGRAGIPCFGVVCLRKENPLKHFRADARKQKTPKKHTPPPKCTKTPQKTGKTPKLFFALTREKKTALFQNNNRFCW